MFADLTLAGATSFINVGYYMGGTLEGCIYVITFCLSKAFNRLCCVATEVNNDSK